MLPLTRRRDPEAREERWHIYYDDVHVGTIAKSAGGRSDVEQWDWICGFHPGERLTGSALDFEQARAEFEAAWRLFSAKRTEAITTPGATTATGRPGNIPCGTLA
jgi:hypothetical protein